MEKEYAIMVAEELVGLAAQADPDTGKRLYALRRWIINRINGIPLQQITEDEEASSEDQ